MFRVNEAIPRESSVLFNEPRSVEATGLDVDLLQDLTLKAILNSRELSGQVVADHLRLPFANIVEVVLSSLVEQELVSRSDVQGGDDQRTMYSISPKGTGKAQEALARSQYVGPAPVPMSAYVESVRAQSIGEIAVKASELRRSFAHMVISDAMLRRIGPAVSSAGSIFVYGPPGDGKTMIADAMSTLLKGRVYVPYAVQVDGHTIQVYDSLNHVPVNNPGPSENGHEGLRTDARWTLCRRPYVVAGAELSLEALDLIYDPSTKIYQAPYQMRASGGIFLIDDFGRQQVSPRDLLNRWIVPLEKRIDFLTLQTGKKIQIPLNFLTVFCTNLNPSDLVDDAFLRRIRHKILVPNPSWDEFREIFEREASAKGIPFDEEGFKYLVVEHYIKARREPKSVHPRDLIDLIVDIAKYAQAEPGLTKELVDGAVEAYFVQL